MGLVAVRDLIESPSVDKVVIGDIETSKAEALTKSWGSDKIKAVRVDATNHDSLVNAIRNSNVLINAVWYEHNLRVMKAAIEAKVHYNDLGGLFHMTRKQMEMDDAARRAYITAVLGGGESPGVTNVLCAASAENLEQVEDIKVSVGGREEGEPSSDKLAFPFAVSTIFDEYSKIPVMYLEGRFQEVEPLSGEEEIEFPEPVGRNKCHYSIHSEIATLPLNFKGVRNVEFKYALSEKIFKAIKSLVNAGLGDPTPIDVRGTKISPREFAIAYLSSRASNEEPCRYVAIRTEVTGRKKGGNKVCEIYEVLGEPSARLGVRNATGSLTGKGASIVAQLILQGKISKRGALGPEACVPPALFIKELEKRGVKIRSKETNIPGKRLFRYTRFT
jgi:saccharopine dehydrogenase-like NADP-dependent oxidoreductase